VTAEARALLGEVETVAVKEAFTRTAARCLAPQVAQQRIRRAAERALGLRAKPFVLPPPITVQIAFQRAGYADQAALIPDSRRVDGRTVEWTGADMPTVYRTARAMLQLALVE
jgi:D-amino peptidase